MSNGQNSEASTRYEPPGDGMTRRQFMHRLGGAVALSGGMASAKTSAADADGGDTYKAVGYDQILRPQFHFSSRTGWINDPNGLVYVNGIYHLFFQHNPFGNVWGHMTWGHAISRDLVHWRQLADAIKPDRLGTIFSGSAAVDVHDTSGLGRNGKPPVIAMYTAAGGTSRASRGRPFTQCLAYSNDGGFTFTKYRHNPVIGEMVPGNRDPKIFYHAPTRRWIAPLFLDAKRGFDLLNSPDLIHWRVIDHIPFPQSQECPNFFPLPVKGKPGEQRWIFAGANNQYLIGTFDGRRFSREAGPFVMDHGLNLYACQIYNDLPAGQNRTVQIGWMRGGRYPHMPFNQQMSFPCELTLKAFAGGLRVCREPVAEMQHLWRRVHHIRQLRIDDRTHHFAGITGKQLDIEAIIRPATARYVGMHICGQTIEIDFSTHHISALGAEAQMETTTIPDRSVRVRMLVDRTSMEVFAPDHAVSLTSCYLSTSSPPFTCYARGGGAAFDELTVREVASAWA